MPNAGIQQHMMPVHLVQLYVMTTQTIFHKGIGFLSPYASEEDYIKLLCTMYDEGNVRRKSEDNSACPEGSEKRYAKDHNYPSMGDKVAEKEPFTVKFHRRVKNVGLPNSTYKAKISLNSKVDIKVVLEVRSFELNVEKTFDVIVVGRDLPKGLQVSGSLVWSDGVHNFRSPIVV
ncbi:subtilisin-like protease SBT4.5 [Pyrus communis]|uniref:subtilisin-like protease SBT4.5 n=1 Tax=Pyrus communis TaxID=23211 RepID=UPI0035BF1AC1